MSTLKNKTLVVAAFSMWIVFGANLVQAVDFNINLQTDKTNYVLGEMVSISGSLIYNGTPLDQGLVAIQVNHNGILAPHIVYRTVYTGQEPPGVIGDINGDGIVDIFDVVIIAAAFGSVPQDSNWDVRADINGDDLVDIFDLVAVSSHYGDTGSPITLIIQVMSVYIADGMGNRVYEVRNGSTYYVYVKYRNSQTSERYARIVFTIYDANNVPIFAFNPISGNVPPGGPFTAVGTWTVPENATLGVASVYASAFADFPQNGGYAYCPEKSSAFSIISSLGSMSIESSPISTMQAPGEFNNSFRIMNNSNWQGTYVVYASSFYYTGQIGLIATNSTTFQVGP